MVHSYLYHLLMFNLDLVISSQLIWIGESYVTLGKKGKMEGISVYLLKKTVRERKDSSPSPELTLAKITPRNTVTARLISFIHLKYS